MEKKLMDFDRKPYDQWTGLKTAPPVAHEGFDSLYEFCKSTSLYHFDESVDDSVSDPPIIIPICKFVGDWDSEVQEMTANTEPATFDYRAETRWDNNNTLEYKDFKRWGYNVDGENPYVVLNRTRRATLTPLLQKIADTFKLENPAMLGGGKPNIKYDVQMPGQMFYWHLDNFGGILKQQRNDYKSFAACDYDQRKIMRLIVFLDDQKPGQVWKKGNSYITWKRGDCMTWPWRDIPHGTANFSHHTRPTLNVTGFVGDATLEFLKTCPREINIE
jgi:hypothetical protein